MDAGGGSRARFEHLCYWYPALSGGFPADPATSGLFDVSLELGAGLNLIGGDSGAGKSTLLRVLNGLVPHFYGGRIAGSASVAGMDVASTPPRILARHVGFVFQEAEAGFVRGTVAREVAFGPENLGFAPGAVERLVADALELVGVAGLAARRLSTLSGGERQRVALAGALAAAPEVVALDEPSSQLDQAGVAALVRILESLAAQGHTVVVAEHRLRPFLNGAQASRQVTMVAGRPAPPSAVTSPPTPAPPMPAPPTPAPLTARSPTPRPHRRRSTEGRTKPVESLTGWATSGLTAGIGNRAVLEGVELYGSPGQIVVLSGPNGSGKTTLLRTIAGLLPPLEGQVIRPVCTSAHGRPVGYLPQDPHKLLHRRSVLAEVRQTLRWSRLVDDPMLILRQLGMDGLADTDPRDLSTGQRQRAALAAVLAGRPALVLLDEPTRGMDAASRMALVTTLGELAADGSCVILATHDYELAEQLGDRIALVDGGRTRLVQPERLGG
ncbi:MAG: ABC transporter ATP-binding protein [Acidimicrobiales bacterium]